MCDDETYEFNPFKDGPCLMDSDLEYKLADRLTKSEDPEESEPSTVFYTASNLEQPDLSDPPVLKSDDKIIPMATSDDNRLGHMENEISKSRNSVYSLASSSSKASTVHALITDTNESKDGSISSGTENGQKPTFIQGLIDTNVHFADTFKLFAKIENCDQVVWTLENEEIEAEPDEGLFIKADGKLVTD